VSILGLDRDTTPTLPGPSRNNTWHSFQDSDRCVVMVHGLGDNSADCWHEKQSGEYWPERIRCSSAFHDYSIFLGGYETSKFTSGAHGFDDCAEDLLDGLQLSVKGRKPVLEHKAIIFVCHSLGGIITRYLLESKREKFQDQFLGLALISSPSTGSAWADAVSYLASFLSNEVVQSLSTSSLLLRDLDSRFKELRNANLIPALFGKEACETEGYVRLVGKIVGEESAGRYFGNVRRLSGTNHSTCVKPSSDTHPAHLFLLRFVDDFEKLYARKLPPRRPVNLICRRLRLSVSIVTDDGDSINELQYSGITAAPVGAVVALRAKQETGHYSDARLIAAFSSASVEFDPSNREQLRFAVPPGPDDPQHLTVRRDCFNAYSMDSRELALKTGRNTGIDWVQKRIDNDQIAELSIMIRFPASLLIDGEPFLQVLQDGNIDTRETQRLARFVDYSPLLNTVSFFIRGPVPDRAYRICWRLAAPRQEKESQTPQRDLDDHQSLVQTLLRLRGLHEVSQPTQPQRDALDRLHHLVGKCAGHIQEMLAGRIAVANLEISLMVVDDSDEERAPTLRLVAGSNLAPGFWTMTMAAGDGNAGRVVKTMSMRVFDAERAAKEPLKHVYKKIEGSQSHRWLMSIPVFSCQTKVFAVLNIGTFEKAQVRVLRGLEDKNELADNIQRIIVPGIKIETSGAEALGYANKG